MKSQKDRIHLCVIFFNVGGYHKARLDSANEMCLAHGWEFSAIQITGNTKEHPWGEFEKPDYLVTLSEHQDGKTPQFKDRGRLNTVLDQLNPTHVAIPGWGFDFSRHALSWCRSRSRAAILMSESKRNDAPRVWWKELIKEHSVIRHFDSAIVGGQLHRDYLEQMGCHPKKIFSGYDVVNNMYYKSTTSTYRNQPDLTWQPDEIRDRRVILSVNRFIPRKNLAVLITAFGNFLNSQDAPSKELWRLVLLGEGQEKSNLEALTDQLDIRKHVLFPGFRSYHEIPKWYASSEMFVHPASAEQWGLVVNEAMAAGLPSIVSTSCGCYPDLILEDQTGLGFIPTDVGQLTQQLQKVAASSKLRSRLGAAGRSHILENFCSEAFGRGLYDCIKVAGTRIRKSV